MKEVLLSKKMFNTTNLTRKEKMLKEKEMSRKRAFKILCCLSLIIGILYFNPVIRVNLDKTFRSDPEVTGIYKAKVMGVKREEYTYLENTYEKNKGVQSIAVEVTNGELKGKILDIQNNYDYTNPYSYVIKKGDKVLLSVNKNMSGSIENVYIHDFDRSVYLIVLVALFLMILIIFGGLKGVKTFISIAIILPIILKVVPYYLLKGYNHLFVIFISSFIIISILSLILWGINKESLSTLIGSVGGMIFGGILLFVFQYLLRITGITSGNMESIVYGDTQINFIGILFGGIIIGSLGAIMHTSLNITKAMREAEFQTMNMKFLELLKVGFREGKETIGAMSSTLILAYLGATLQTVVILMVSNNMSLTRGINGETMVLEVLRIITGVLGFIFAIPVTTLAYALISKRNVSK